MHARARMGHLPAVYAYVYGFAEGRKKERVLLLVLVCCTLPKDPRELLLLLGATPLGVPNGEALLLGPPAAAFGVLAASPESTSLDCCCCCCSWRCCC